MKKKNFIIKQIITSLSICTVLCGNLYSQTELQQDSIIAGKTYKFVLFDDTELIGRVIYADSLKIKIQDRNTDYIVISRDNLLYYSTSAVPSKYSFSISMLAGVSLYTMNDNYNYYGGHKMKSGINLDLAGIYYFSDTKGLKFDLGYSFLKAKYEEDVIPAIYPYYPHTFSGGDVSNMLFKANFILGSFNPQYKFMGYGSLGLGIHLTNQNEVSETYYDSYDSVYRTSTYPANSEINAVISLGGGLAYRFSKYLGAHAEIEYNLVTAHESFFFFYGGRGYFPLRIGLIYTFY